MKHKIECMNYQVMRDKHKLKNNCDQTNSEKL